ncbi:MAG: uroporphyrinogen-III C-methyltransferase [Rhodospirillaceae bacterium]
MFDSPYHQSPGLELPEFKPGWVWLAGAGPGDPGLLTIHALHALRWADVIIHDALIDPGTLALATPGAEMIHAGKRGGQPSCKQIDITAMLIEQARRSRRVLRLKGGDPMMFGRGAEELMGLSEAAVPFRVIPGVSAGLGGLAAAGIPLTCRGVNEVVTFVTGHDIQGRVPESVDWAALARGSTVLVLFMAIRTLPEIVRRLRAGGRAAEEPVAIVRAASTADQEVFETTLEHCVAIAAGVAPPALVVIGEVVRLRATLDPARQPRLAVAAAAN